MTDSRQLWIKSKKAALFSLYSPFVISLVSETLDVEVFRHYIAQDFYFLQSFAQAYELAGEWVGDGDDEVRRILFELREAVLEELKMHTSIVEEWGGDISKETKPNPATLKYIGFLLATAKGIVEGDGFTDTSITPERNKYAAYTVGSMVPCMRLYAFLGKEIQMFLEPNESTHLYKNWIDTYSSASFEASALQIEVLLDKLSAHLTGYEIEVIEKLYVQAMNLEFEFFCVQPIVQPTVVPLTRYSGQIETCLVIITDFDMTCTDVDSCAVLAEAAIHGITRIDDKLNTSTALELKRSWDDLSTQYVEEYEQCLTNILGVAVGRGKEFDYEALYEALEKLSEFEKLANLRVINSGLLRGANMNDIKDSGGNINFKSGCLDFLQNIVNKKTDLNVYLHVLSLCWCGDLIKAAFSLGGLSDIKIYSNDLHYENSFSTGELILRLQTPIDKAQTFNKILEDSQENRKHLSIYIGDSLGDLLCLLEADVGIVIGSSTSLRTVGTHFGVTFKPLLPGLIEKQRRLAEGEPFMQRGFSGTLYTMSCWEEIHAFILGAP